MENQDYIPFGKEWKEEMGNDPKALIVDSQSDELRVAKYNSEHSDSAMEIHYLPAVPQAYDGSKLNRFYVGFDPFDIMPTIRGKTSIYDRMIGIIRFRLPRKLKKKIKKHYSGTYTKRDARFFLDCVKTAKYYGCKILKERSK